MGGDLQSGGSCVNLWEHKDTGRSTLCSWTWIENKKDFDVCALNVTLEQTRKGKNCVIKAVTSKG